LNLVLFNVRARPFLRARAIKDQVCARWGAPLGGAVRLR